MSAPVAITEPRLLGAAHCLATARLERHPVPRVSETFALANLDEAYAVQAAGMQQALAQGRRLCGAKAGLTSAALRAALKVDEPVYGRLFADTACLSGEAIAWERLLQPKVEIELALVLGHDLPAGEISHEQFLACIAGAVPALEINDSAIIGWQLTLMDAVADNISSGLYVLGDQPVPLAQLPTPNLLISLHKNAQPVLLDTSVALHDCLATGLWLVRKLARRGQPLRAGDVLLTGALAPMLDVGPGDHVRMVMGEHGAVECSFAGTTA